jgi:hypothetical protein
VKVAVRTPPIYPPFLHLQELTHENGRARRGGSGGRPGRWRADRVMALGGGNGTTPMPDRRGLHLRALACAREKGRTPTRPDRCDLCTPHRPSQSLTLESAPPKSSFQLVFHSDFTRKHAILPL